MNRRRIVYLVLIFIAFFIFLIYYTLQSVIYPNPHINLSLNTLRAKIKEEFKYNIKPLLIDNVCGIENKTGTCYFNSTIQSFFSDRYIVLFFIMNNFDKTQYLSLTLQNIIYKMLTNTKVNLITELNSLIVDSVLKNYFRVTGGGDPSYCIDRLIEQLDKELGSINIKGAPNNFFINKNMKFTCSCNKENNIKNRFTILEIDFGNDFIKCLQNYIKKNFEEFKYKMLRCTFCKKYDTQKISVTYQFGDYLIIENGRVIHENKKFVNHEGAMDIYEIIQLDKHKYMLTAIICSYGSFDRFHVNVVVLKGDKWYQINDSKIEEIDFYKKKCVRNNSWIYLYKKIN